MNTLATWKTLALVLAASLAIHCDSNGQSKEFDAVDGPNVRVLRHDDGSRTLFTRSPDNLRLTAKRFSANGVLNMLTVYTMFPNGNPSGCKISDGQNQLLFKISYGYRKSDGLLVEERMFDARTIRKDPNTGKEMPVRTVKYVYDAQGNRSKPMVFSHLPGKTYEEVFGVKPADLEVNPFKDGSPKAPANPNARPVGR